MINRLCPSMKIMKWNIYFDSPVLYIVEETFLTFVKSCIISNWRMVELEFRGFFFTDEKRKWNIRIFCVWSVIKERDDGSRFKIQRVYKSYIHPVYIFAFYTRYMSITSYLLSLTFWSFNLNNFNFQFFNFRRNNFIEIVDYSDISSSLRNLQQFYVPVKGFSRERFFPRIEPRLNTVFLW